MTDYEKKELELLSFLIPKNEETDYTDYEKIAKLKFKNIHDSNSLDKILYSFDERKYLSSFNEESDIYVPLKQRTFKINKNGILYLKTLKNIESTYNFERTTKRSYLATMILSAFIAVCSLVVSIQMCNIAKEQNTITLATQSKDTLIYTLQKQLSESILILREERMKCDSIKPLGASYKSDTTDTKPK